MCWLHVTTFEFTSCRFDAGISHLKLSYSLIIGVYSTLYNVKIQVILKNGVIGESRVWSIEFEVQKSLVCEISYFGRFQKDKEG